MSVLPGSMSQIVAYERMQPTPYKDIYKGYIDSEGIDTFMPTATIHRQKVRGKINITVVPPTPANIGMEPVSNGSVPLLDIEEFPMLWRNNYDYDEMWDNFDDYIDGADVAELDVKAYADGMKFARNMMLINGNGLYTYTDGTPIKTLHGLKYRLLNPGVYHTNPAMNVAASSTTTMVQGSGAAPLASLVSDLGRVFSYMNAGLNGDGVLIVVNPQFMRNLDAMVALAGTQGGFGTEKDAFGRTVTTFRGAKFVSCGLLPPTSTGLQVAPIIDNAQDANGLSAGDTGYTSGTFYTSAYFIKPGADSFQTWQVMEPKMRKVQVAGTRTIRIMWDTTMGIWNPNPRAIARLYKIPTNGPSDD